MNFLNDLSIKSKLIASFGVAAALLVAGTLTGILASRIVSSNLNGLLENQAVASQRTLSLVANVAQIHSTVLNLAQDPTRFTQLAGQILQLSNQVEDTIQKQIKDDHSAAVATLNNSWQAYRADLNTLVNNFKVQNGDQSDISQTPYNQSWITFLDAVTLWQNQILKNTAAETAQSNQLSQQISLALLVAGLLGILVAFAVVISISNSINRPLSAVVANMQKLSRGELCTPASDVVRRSVVPRGDELGILGKELVEIENYLETSSRAASEVAAGNLSVNFRPQSVHDQLGTAMQRMIENLNTLASEVAASSQQVGDASHRLLDTAQQANQGSAQISSAIHLVATGINQQSGKLSQALSAVEHTDHILQRVSQGAQDQQHAVVLENQIASDMNSSIRDTTVNIQEVVKLADLSSAKANQGANTIHKAIASIHSIRTQMITLGEKVSGMSVHSNEINTIVETIEDIALKTNILSINATIEAAHAKTQVKELTENILNQMMISQCQVVSRLINHTVEIQDQNYWKALGSATALDTILVTDENGVVVYCNEEALIGWRFPDDPKSQTFPFLKLIHQTDGVFCQPSQERSLDKKIYKYVGITRADQPGIIQVGFNTDSLKKFEVRTEGFAVVAEEVYKLSEQSQTATREIRRLNSGIQTSIKESELATNATLQNVDSSRAQTDEAGQVLANILTSVQDVFQQAQNVLASTRQMSELSSNLIQAVQTVSKVTEQNSADAQAMIDSYSLITAAMKSIAALSQQNSATANEVSYSTKKIHGQIEQVKVSAHSLNSLAENLDQAVTQFHLN